MAIYKHKQKLPDTHTTGAMWCLGPKCNKQSLKIEQLYYTNKHRSTVTFCACCIRKQIKKWSRKGSCPFCGVSTGSKHNIHCKIAFKAIGKMKK